MVSRKAQQGLSLVELIITTGAGLLLLVCLIQTFYGTSVTYNVVNTQTELKHTGQITTDYLARLIYHAGYWSDVTFKKKFAAEHGFALNGFISGVDNYTGNPDRIDGSDSITIRMTGAEDGLVTLCNKSILLDGQLAIQHLYLTNAGVPALMCNLDVYNFDKNTGSVQLPAILTTDRQLIPQVETFQILYAIGKDDALRWVKASEVTDWTEVRMLEFGVLVGANERIYGAPATPKTYQVFEKTVVVTDEKTPRQVFTRSVLIRNSLAGAM